MQVFARVCEEAARAGGAVLMAMRGQVSAREKAPADLVTEADLASQEAIRCHLLTAFPTHNFLGEESAGLATESQSEFTWIVDPLDGTTNYVHGFENFCVSVALQKGPEIVVGAIYDPIRDACFRATLGTGAFRNDKTIQVSNVKSLEKALVAASLSPRVARESAEVRRFLEVMFHCQAVRRLGSAAMNLCYVASGQLDAYWATSVMKWDIAAGLLIVQEAGGTITDLESAPVNLDEPRFVAAGQPDLHSEIVELFRCPK